MLEKVKSLDESLFLWLNSFHYEFLDSLMLLITHRLTWIPFYVMMLVYLYQNIKKQKILTILTIILAVGLADYVTSGLMKPYFMRPRPCYNPNFTAFIHVPGKCGGQFGFASSHAANSFALFTALFLRLGWHNNWTKFTLIWAVVVSYSRIYVGVHYPADILVGMLVGFVIASLVKKSSMLYLK